MLRATEIVCLKLINTLNTFTPSQLALRTYMPVSEVERLIASGEFDRYVSKGAEGDNEQHYFVDFRGRQELERRLAELEPVVVAKKTASGLYS